jgi:hypothetical protein
MRSSEGGGQSGTAPRALSNLGLAPRLPLLARQQYVSAHFSQQAGTVGQGSCHRTVPIPTSRATGGAIVPPHVLSYFRREYEVFLL